MTQSHHQAVPDAAQVTCWTCFAERGEHNLGDWVWGGMGGSGPEISAEVLEHSQELWAAV